MAQALDAYSISILFFFSEATSVFVQVESSELINCLPPLFFQLFADQGGRSNGNTKDCLGSQKNLVNFVLISWETFLPINSLPSSGSVCGLDDWIRKMEEFGTSVIMRDLQYHFYYFFIF